MNPLLSIIYEDDDILVINKPSSLVVHPFDHSTEETLLDTVSLQKPTVVSFKNEKKLQDGRIINLGGMVHKLDRDTSGVMMLAKNKETFTALQTLFLERKIEKTYTALIDGIIEQDMFTVEAPLGRNKKDYKQVAYPQNPRGELREAITLGEVVHRNEATTLVTLTPKTGRTHQLRAHMAYIGHPIVGDIAYGSKTISPRIMLHAQRISFTLDNKKCSFESPTPEIFLQNQQ